MYILPKLPRLTADGHKGSALMSLQQIWSFGSIDADHIADVLVLI